MFEAGPTDTADMNPLQGFSLATLFYIYTQAWHFLDQLLCLGT